MISTLQINNYKSLHELTLDVGRFNVLIGENGCGKSNVLEVIGLAAAAAADKLDNEFLRSRGIRVTEPRLMRSAFDNENIEKPIQIQIKFENLEELQKYTLINDNHDYASWIRDEFTNVATTPQGSFIEQSKKTLSADDIRNVGLLLSAVYNAVDSIKNDKARIAAKIALAVGAAYGTAHIVNSISKNSDTKYIEDFVEKKIESQTVIEHFSNVAMIEDILTNFLIYAPENTPLRNFSKEGQIEPLGINGEGLLKLLKVIQSKSPEQLEEIVTCLELFDWFDGLHIPKDFSSYEDKVTITDRFLSTAFDQRSANEGFLFVLFYIALMVSDDTPKIFAIDNIDVALNPKMCTKLIKELVRLAKKYDKQVFVTTHNPAILDGIDLGDDEQRLLVLSRNKAGHTRVKRIELKDKPRSSTDEELRLSEAFLRGYLGGLPKGF
ncbi:MAG: chromosome segregation protein SMC [Methylobacter sp.]|nr:MAG: chromosome segregation protein SMC [Methylobacter sp.]